MENTKKKTTMRDIARKVGVDHSTVSLALADSPRVSAHTRKLVHKTAQKMGYILDKRAGSIKNRRSYVLGMIVPAFSQIYVPTVIDAAYQRAFEQNYHLQVVCSANSAEGERQAVTKLLEERVEGVLIIEMRPKHEREERQGLRLIQQHAIPTAILGPVAHHHFNQVALSIRSFTQYYCADILQKGRRKIALITRHSGALESYISDQQERGFRTSMKSAGIKNYTDLMFIHTGQQELVELGYAAAKQLWERHRPETMIVGNDLIAEGVNFFAQKEKLHYERDFTLVSLANTPFPIFGHQPYASSIMPLYQCGEALVDLVLGQIRAGESWQPQQWLFHLSESLRHNGISHISNATNTPQKIYLNSNARLNS